jgi:hypothetical protein
MKNKKQIFRRLFAVLIGFLICNTNAWAEILNQSHFRTGMVSSSLGSSVGSKTGGGAVLPSFDFEYESFKSDRKSSILHAVLAHETQDSVTRYFFAGAGFRYYLRTRGSNEIATSQDIGLIIRPTFRSYFGWEVGLSENVINVVTPSLQSLTTAIDGGAYFGTLYRLSNNVSLDAHIGMNFALGFSSVAASGMIMKIMSGISYSF